MLHQSIAPKALITRSPREVPLRGAEIHPAWCACGDCRAAAERRQLRHEDRQRAWAMLFLTLLAALYGAVLAFLPEIAASFGWAL